MPFQYFPPPFINVDEQALGEKSWFAVAKMLKDGTIVIDERDELSNGTLVEGRDVFKPNDPRYKEVLRHLGKLKPGQEKIAPPWDAVK